MAVDDVINDVTSKSDIARDSDLYEQIARELTELGLNLAFFVFTTREHSSCARTLDGKTASYPTLTIYLKYNTDFQQTRIDRHSGNWDDRWEKTRSVRGRLNTILQRHGFDIDNVSDQTFVFVRTLEELAFHEIGRQCKNALQQFICDEAPGVAVSHVFWNGQQYDVIMETKADFDRVTGRVKARASKVIPSILAAADKDGHCQRYNAGIDFGFSGMNLFHLIREDL